MGLFRKMFNKTSEEPSEEPETVQQPQQSVVIDTQEVEGLDPSTQPVNVPPPQNVVPQRPVIDSATQQLSSDMLVSTNSSCITFGQVSDVGLVRSNNQDAAVSFFFTSASADERPDFGLFVVADGMGGYNGGEKASAITVKTIATHLTQQVYIPILNGNASVDIAPISEIMATAVQKANVEILKHVPEGGTTVTAVSVLGDLAYIAHVGDSRAYLITKDNIEQITRDHSLVQRLIELDQITQEEAPEHPQKNVLYRALGQNDNVDVDIVTRRLPPNSRVLICSDGLWGLVNEKDLFEVAMNTTDPQQACDKLVALANTNGGTDNITVILLKIS